MSFPQKIPLFLCVALFLTHVTTDAAAWPGGIGTEENHVSENDTSPGFPSHVQKRYANNIPPCKEIISLIDPRKYFQTDDIFIPRVGKSVECQGSPAKPATCGPKKGRMQCVTRLGSLEFLRMPSYVMCWKRKTMIIPNVPVGCYCM